MVIFSLLSVVPFGSQILLYIFGSFSISTRTLSLIFFLHFLLPFILLVLIIIHLFYLHLNLSSNTTFLDGLDLVTFFPFFVFLDLFVVILLFLFLIMFIFFFSYYFFESTNWVAFISLSTPLHIYPD